MPPGKSEHADADSSSAGVNEEVSLDKLLTHRLNIAAKLMNRQSSRFLAKHFGLSIAEWWVLGQLGQHSPRTLRWLAEATQTDKAQLSRAAASLVKRGHVRRRADPNDARSVLFWITSKGRKLFEEITPSRVAVNEALLEKLSPAERDMLLSSLDAMIDFFYNEASE